MPELLAILSKDPRSNNGGDGQMTRLVLSLARESMSVRVVALGDGSGGSDGADIEIVKKPVVRPFHLLVNSALRGTSLIHARFDTPALRSHLGRVQPDKFLAEHSYMAESFLATHGLQAGREALYVDTHVSEADVWRSTRSALLRLEALRIERDELRVALSSRSVGSFGVDEVSALMRRGVTAARHLPITLPNKPYPARVSESSQRIVFVGDRTWPPNHEAVRWMLPVFRQVRARVPAARLSIIGRRRSPKVAIIEPGVDDLAFVEDLDGAMRGARIAIAPVLSGGGVRVKVLEAISYGLPVVGTSAGLGGLASQFGIASYDDQDEFASACVRLLQEPALSEKEGLRLYSQNGEIWRSQTNARLIQDWLQS